MGDPETEVVLPRIESDFLSLLLAAARGTLNEEQIQISEQFAVTTMVVAGGYPEEYRKGDVISGLDQDLGNDCKVFHAGTARQGEDIVTAGGRVLCVSALGDDIAQAHLNNRAMLTERGIIPKPIER